MTFIESQQNLLLPDDHYNIIDDHSCSGGWLCTCVVRKVVFSFPCPVLLASFFSPTEA